MNTSTAFEPTWYQVFQKGAFDYDNNHEFVTGWSNGTSVHDMVTNYMKDGMITFAVGQMKKGGRGYVQATFARLEKELGINFELVDYSDAEIKVNFVDAITGLSEGESRVNGLATITNELDPVPESYTVIEVLDDGTNPFWRGVLTHEIGHALGLGHDHDTIHSIMSYNRNRAQQWFMPQDMAALHALYGV